MLPIPLDMFWLMEPTAFQKIQSVAVSLPAIQDRVRSEDLIPMHVSGNTAIISIQGPMMKNPSWMTAWFGGTSTLMVRRAVEAAVSDPDIKTIVLDVDSPGGSVDGLAELGDAVFKARESKRVVAQVNGGAFSAAYYVASQAHTINAGRMDMVGSIGTRIMLYDFSEAFKDAGIEAVPIDTGWFKSAGAEGTEITDEQRAEFQKIVDLYFDDFLSVVARGRSMAKSAVKAVADGRMFVAGEAKSLGLIDRIQTLDVTMGKLSQSRQRSRHTARQQQSIRIAQAGL